MKLIINKKVTFKKLNVNEMGIKKIKVEQKDKTFTIIKNLTVDLSKNIKFLTLASEIVLHNHSDTPIHLHHQKVD